jgi:hypothetical protein
VRAERLGIAFESFLSSQVLTAEQARWARQIGEQIRAQAADIASFELYRLTRPPFSLQGGMQRIREAFGGEEALGAFLRRLNVTVFDDTGQPHGSGAQAAPH